MKGSPKKVRNCQLFEKSCPQLVRVSLGVSRSSGTIFSKKNLTLVFHVKIAISGRQNLILGINIR